MPESLVGGLVVTLVNMLTVFLVLGLIAALIRLVHAVVSRAGTAETQAAPREILVVSSHAEVEEGEVALPEDIDGAKKAAVLAAISMVLGKSEAAMFVRDVRDCGAWGRQSRRHSQNQSVWWRSAPQGQSRRLGRSSGP